VRLQSEIDRLTPMKSATQQSCRPGFKLWRPANLDYTAQTQHSCHQPQSSGSLAPLSAEFSRPAAGFRAKIRLYRGATLAHGA
jgi:hypothetical protein